MAADHRIGHPCRLENPHRFPQPIVDFFHTTLHASAEFLALDRELNHIVVTPSDSQNHYQPESAVTP